MKSLLKNDNKKRKVVKTFENKNFILKSIIKNNNFSILVKLNIILEQKILPKNSSKTRIVNRCILTGFKSKIYSDYKFSRFVVLKLIRSNLIFGTKQSVW